MGCSSIVAQIALSQSFSNRMLHFEHPPLHRLHSHNHSVSAYCSNPRSSQHTMSRQQCWVGDSMLCRQQNQEPRHPPTRPGLTICTLAHQLQAGNWFMPPLMHNVTGCRQVLSATGSMRTGNPSALLGCRLCTCERGGERTTTQR